MKLSISGAFHKSTTKFVEESQKLPILNAKAKEAHTFGTTPVEPCLLTAVNILVGAESQKIYKEVGL
jgi:hypothetical protein